VDSIELLENFSDFITIDKASKLLGVSKQTVRKWEKEGKLKSVRHPVNGYRLFKNNDIKEILWKLKKEIKQ
jgi:excisionase family DNA binding protein